MIAWTDERRRVVLELRAGVEVPIPRSRVLHAIEVLTLGRVQHRRRAAERWGLSFPVELLEASTEIRSQAAAIIQRQAAQIVAAVNENKRWQRWTSKWDDTKTEE
jgi:hypothetical protein